MSIDIIARRDAQRQYCRANSVPMFAPTTGFCPNCGRNIYDGPYGYTEAKAGSTLITGCPYCHRSYVD